MVTLVNHDTRTAVHLRRGDRVAQLVLQRVARPRFHEVDRLPGSDRGERGHGSTGGFTPAIEAESQPGSTYGETALGRPVDRTP
jgi:dUTP pyrophosphatase